MQEEDFTLDEWSIYMEDCYASNLHLLLFLCGHVLIIAVEQSVRNTFPSKVWYVANDTGIPFMVDQKRRYQDQCMLEYWQARDAQAVHDEVYHGSSTYMVPLIENLR